MHTLPVLKKEDRLKYEAYLQTDHDFRVWADVLTLEEEYVSTAELLDGQVNFVGTGTGPQRTASITLSDPDRALSFGVSYARDDQGVLWVNRLVRLMHSVDVPGLGTITAPAMIGVPTAVSRKGAELGLELSDKTVLADHGVRPKTYKKGTRVDRAIEKILREQTGEHHLRIPVSRKTLSRSYTVGMGDENTTPWEVAQRIAEREEDWRLYYSNDGYATAESTDTVKAVVEVVSLLALPDASTSFTDFVNYVKVTSLRKPKNKKLKKAGAKIKIEGVAELLVKDELSEESLARNTVPRTLPMTVDDNSLGTEEKVSDRAVSTLKKNSGFGTEQAYEIMPFFHLDMGDKLKLPLKIGEINFDNASIPLGVGGNMTINRHAWVSRPVTVKRGKPKSSVVRKKGKGGKKSGNEKGGKGKK